MKGATERWVELNGKEVVANLFRTEKEFYQWATRTNCDWNEHPTCPDVEKLVHSKSLQFCKLYRITRIEYVGYLLPNKIDK